MSITSWGFVLFLSITLLLYYTVFAGGRQWICLLLASIVFYMFSGPKNLVFLLTTALTCWLGALWMEKRECRFKEQKKHLKESLNENPKENPKENMKNPELLTNPGEADRPETENRAEAKAQLKAQIKEAKALMQKDKLRIAVLVLLINFGLLALVKYWGVAYRGWLLPLGMSFYTFQSIGYLLDVYNGKVQAERNFVRYFLFISFFPQLIQGPIGRYDQLEPQLTADHHPSWEAFKRAALLILFGLIKKYAIANILSPAIAALLDDHIQEIPGSAVVFAVLMYSFQQYADFSGGIDMVTGAAMMFGISLAPNFRQPYFAVSLGDFWRRWHISLGAWMRDYVFYPFALLKPVQRLGKFISKRCGKHLGVVLPASIANILVFFLVGIWHGLEGHYVLWGLYNGIVIAASDICSPWFRRLGERLHMQGDSKGMQVFRVIRTFLIVNIGWYFDRIYQLGDCLHAFCVTLTPGLFRMEDFPETVESLLLQSGILTGARILLAVLGIVVLTITDWMHEKGRTVYDGIAARPRIIRWCVFWAILVFVQLAMDYSNASSAFLYANF